MSNLVSTLRRGAAAIVLIALVVVPTSRADVVIGKQGTNAPGTGADFPFTIPANCTGLRIHFAAQTNAGHSYLYLKKNGSPTEIDFDYVSRSDLWTNRICIEPPEFDPAITNYGLRVFTPPASPTHSFVVAIIANAPDRALVRPAIKPASFTTTGVLTNSASKPLARWQVFQVDVPTALASWRITAQTTNNLFADLYLSKELPPDTNAWLRASLSGNPRELVLTNGQVAAGTWFIGVHLPLAETNTTYSITATATLPEMPPDPATVFSFTNGAPITINDATASGASAATPYPSSITVDGLSGTISNVTVTLRGYRHSWPDDVDVLLVGPGGHKVLLMSDAGGGNARQGINLTFDDGAVQTLPDSSVVNGGNYRPTNFDTNSDNFPSPAPNGPYGGTLADFTNSGPNGTWSLYVQDDNAMDNGSIADGWSLMLELIVPQKAPVIVRQPQDQFVFPGQSAAFTLAASNAVSYEWRLNGSPVPDDGRFLGSATANLTLLTSLSGDSGAQFSCIVGNANGSVTSSVAQLTVLLPAKPFFTAPLFTIDYFQATLHGAPMSNYVVEVSSDLVNWNALKTVTTTTGSTNVIDASAGPQPCFYRAKLLPSSNPIP